MSVGITRHSQGLPVATGTQEWKGLIKTIRRESQTIIRPLRDSLGKVFRRPHEQCQIVRLMKDGNEGLGGTCSKRTPTPLQHQCPCTAARQGRGSSVARQGWREDSDVKSHSLGSTFAHLLQQTQKQQAAGCPGAAGIFSFPYSQLLALSPAFLSAPKQREGSGLSTMALEAAAGKPASSSSVPATDKLHSTLRDDLVTKASLSCLLGQDSSKTPGTFLTASSSRQNRLQGEGNPSMVLSSRVQNVRAQEHPALLGSPQVVPA